MAAKKSPKQSGGDTGYVALFRGINVGGKNVISMDELRGLFAKARCTDIRSYIQSGNVLFRAPQAVRTNLEETISGAIESSFGFSAPVVIRSSTELQAAAAGNPFASPTTPPSALHVGFLRSAPTKEQLATLDPNRGEGDTFAVVGRHLYLNCPNGLARTKLTNQYFDSRLGTVSTFRNWNTVQKLLALATEQTS